MFSEKISNLIPEGKFRSILVSVVPAVDALLEKVLPGLIKAGSEGHYPYPHEILNPQAVGADRFCNMAAAVASGLQSALVVDAGTATTFDLLQDGVFKGGLIAPGMAFAARQLAIKGALLEEAPFEKRPFTVGRDSRAAMSGGAWLTGCGGVQWTIEKLLESYGEMPVILTGGLGSMLPAEDRYFDVFWTLRGAWHLAEAGNSVAGPEGG
jgi:type III pantothenate kinase